ncbi:MAG: RNA methyltransferase [bacterium]|nr:RNA methyltransferase [bacterium]MDT8395697.1 RNA methyltransferase [bacterium]
MTDREHLEQLLLPDRLERFREVLAGRTSSVTAVLENLHKDHNISAVLRTCESFGIQRVHVVPQPGHGRVFDTVTRGCDRWLTIQRHPDVTSCLMRLRADGFRILAGALEERAEPLESVDFSGRIALIFSNELQGASREALDMVDGCFVIPMAGFSQSLNVSVAAGIAIHRVMQYKRSVGEELEPVPPEEAALLMDLWVKKSVRNAGRILKELKIRGSRE